MIDSHQQDRILDFLRDKVSHIISPKQKIDLDSLTVSDLLSLIQQLCEQNQQHSYQQIVICNTQVSVNSQKLQEYSIQLKILQTNLKSLTQQRQQIYSQIECRENQLHSLDKRIQSIRVGNPVTQQLDELIEGITMCKEKCDLLEEENQQFKKMCTHESNMNVRLKQKHEIIRDRYDSNVFTLQQLEEHGQLLNSKMMKQLKIVNDLRYFIKSQNSEIFQTATPMRKQKIDNFISGQCSLEDTCISFKFFIEESYNNFDSLKANSNTIFETEKDLSDCLTQVIEFKNHLAQINSKELSEREQSFGNKSRDQKNLEEEVLVSSAFRYKTHQNLGEGQIRKRQISNCQDDMRAFSELDEVEEDQISDKKEALITDGMYIEEEMTPRQPWYYKSAMPLSNKKALDFKFDYGSEKKRYKSKPSFASFTSNSSCNKGCTMTLKDEFQSMYQQQSQEVEENDEFKEKDTEVNNSYEIPGLIQQEQIISDSTILISRKQKQVKFQEEKKSTSPIVMLGITAVSIGLVGWGIYKKYF